MNPHLTFAARARAWLARLAGSGQSATAPRCDPALLRRAIEQVVDGIDPRLHAVLDYARKLTPAVERTIAYFIDCGQWLAAPVEFSAHRWAGDPLVRTLFATAAELQRFFSDDPGVRAYFHDHPLADEGYIGLGVTRQERRVFGMAMNGETIRREVPQTAISFSDYRLFGACDNEQQLRQNIEQRGFGFLIGEALEQIVEHQSSARGHEHEQQFLELRLRGLMQKRSAMDSLYYESNAALDDEIAALRTRLMHEQEALASTRVKTTMLDDYIAVISAVLADPERYVKRATVRLRINRMNIKAESPDEPGDELTFSEVTIGGRPPRVVVLTRFPRRDLLAARNGLDEALQSLRR
ncbi:MAG: hypothetical protein Q7J84_01180 [Sulfuricaulis sp.]|nr:hypothetical protein [Sulfuricaulis sp.]